MDKVLIIIDIPLLDKTYEIKVPLNKKIGTLKILVLNGINSLDDGILKSIGNLYFYDKQSCSFLDENQTLFDMNIKNGTELILI